MANQISPRIDHFHYELYQSLNSVFSGQYKEEWVYKRILG